MLKGIIWGKKKSWIQWTVPFLLDTIGYISPQARKHYVFRLLQQTILFYLLCCIVTFYLSVDQPTSVGKCKKLLLIPFGI